MPTCPDSDKTVSTLLNASEPGQNCALAHVRDAAAEALAELAAVQLSATADLRSRPEYWVGVLECVVAALLDVTEPGS